MNAQQTADLQSKKEYAYSFNQEDYSGKFGTLEEALEEAKACKHLGHDNCWIGEAVTITWEDFNIEVASNVLSEIKEYAWEELHESVVDVIEELEEKCTDELNEIIFNFLKSKEPEFTAFKVINEKEYKL